MHTYILTKGLMLFNYTCLLTLSLHTLYILYCMILCDFLSSSTDVDSNNNNEIGKLNPHFHFTHPECSGEEYRITDCQYT